MRDIFIKGQDLNLWYLNALLADLPKDKLAAQPSGLKNHPLWTLGHLLIAADGSAAMLGAAAVCPAEWKPLFGMGSKPVADIAAYPPMDAIMNTLVAARSNLGKAFLAASDADLARPNPVERMAGMFPTIGTQIALGMVSHESVHLGQLSSWRRVMGLPVIF